MIKKHNKARKMPSLKSHIISPMSSPEFENEANAYFYSF